MRRLRPKTAARFPRSRLGVPISQLRYATHKTFPKRTPDFNEPPGGCSDHKLLEYGAIVGFFGALFALDVAFTVAFECLTDMFKDKSFPPRVMERIIQNNTNASFPTEVQEITESHRNIFTLLLSSLDLPPQQKSCVHMVSVGPDLLPYLIILSVDAKAAVLLGKPYDEQKTNALMYVLQGYLDGATKDLKPGYIVGGVINFHDSGGEVRRTMYHTSDRHMRLVHSFSDGTSEHSQRMVVGLKLPRVKLTTRSSFIKGMELVPEIDE